MTPGNQLQINCDGGSRGNPGPGACAFVVKQNGLHIYKQGQYLGIVTNNQAEYSGVIYAFKWLLSHSDTISFNLVIFYLDSQLVVNQLIGKFKIKNQQIAKRVLEIKSFEKEYINKTGFKILYYHIPRNLNAEADLLVNQTLDSISS